MSAAIPFSRETYRPLCIKGNATSESPTEFDLQAVGGASRARLKSIIIATSGLEHQGDWSPAVQEAVIKAFETGASVFAEGVTKIRGLTAPAALFQRVGLVVDLPKGLDPESQIPVTNGVEYSALCGYWPILSFELAMALARVSKQAEIDSRFFPYLWTSLGLPGIPPGTAPSATMPHDADATAGSRTRKGSRRRTTSRTRSS
jgi:hypothetical protein